VLQTGSWISPRLSILPQKGKESRESRESKKLEISLAPFFALLHGFSSFFCQQYPAKWALTEAARSSLFLARRKTGIQASDAPITFFGI
jgi:hypothetical protein